MRFILILLFVLLLNFSILNLQAEENDLMLEARITQPDESKGGELDFTDSIEETLRDSDLETAVGWKGGVKAFPAILDIELSDSASIDVVVCRWKAMPSDYELQYHTGSGWKTLASVRDNVVLGPKIKLHIFSPVKTDRLRLRITGTVDADIHGRRAGEKSICELAGVEIYPEGKLPAYIEDFLNKETPRLVATRESIQKDRRSGKYRPSPALLTTEIPTFEPIPSSDYSFKPTGKDVNLKSGRRVWLLERCAWTYAQTGDERYAEKAREVLLKIMDHHDRYQTYRFTGITWHAVTFQDPAYNMHTMNTGYDLIAASPCMTREDKLRFVFWLIDNAEFQYRAIRDYLVGRYNWSANSLGEIVLTAYYYGGPEAARWVEMADKRLNECFEPFLDDGYWWECSPAHSVYTLYGLCKYGIGKHLLGDPIWDREYEGKSLEYVIEALAKTMTPFGEYPSINDSTGNDNPLLAEHPEFLPVLYMIGRGDLLKMMKDTGDTPFVPGISLPRPKSADPSVNSLFMPNAGVAIMRDGWERDDSYLLMDYGPHGGGHGHVDKLSIIMFANGHHWIPDAGCSPHYCIFPEQVSWHKQTIAHNTVLVNDESQKQCEGKLILWKSDDQIDIASAEHSEGYPGLIHRRTVVHPRREYFIIHDTLWSDTEETYNLDWLLHIYGEFKSQTEGRMLFTAEANNKLLILSEEIGAEPVEIHQGLCGGMDIGKKEGSGYPEIGTPGWIYIPYIRLKKQLRPDDRRQEYFAVLYPYVGEGPKIVIEEIRDDNGRASGIRISHDGMEDIYIEVVMSFAHPQ